MHDGQVLEAMPFEPWLATCYGCGSSTVLAYKGHSEACPFKYCPACGEVATFERVRVAP